MANTTTDLNLFNKAIEFGVKQRVKEITEEEIKSAQERIEGRVRGEIDRIALNLCSEYSCERHGTDIRIIVKK